MTEFLIETQCLPPVPTFQFLRQKGNIRIEVHENYQKRSFRNRFHVAGPNGLESFTIPLRKGKNQGQDISNVKIAYDEDWVRQLSEMLQTNYGSAPFYHHYIDELMEIFNLEISNLLDLNMSLLEWAMKHLRWDYPIFKSSEYQSTLEVGIEDLRNRITPKSLKSREADVIYNQVYEERHGFIPNLSILDMIMCCGPESTSLIQSK